MDGWKEVWREVIKNSWREENIYGVFICFFLIFIIFLYFYSIFEFYENFLIFSGFNLDFYDF